MRVRVGVDVRLRVRVRARAGVRVRARDRLRVDGLDAHRPRLSAEECEQHQHRRGPRSTKVVEDGRWEGRPARALAQLA